MVYRNPRQRVALTLVAMSLFALGYCGPGYAADADSSPEAKPEKEKTPLEILYDKLVKGFYGTMDVSGDYATKGMSHMTAAGGIGWTQTGITGSGVYSPATHIKMANCPNAAQPNNCNPYPVGNVGWEPLFPPNKWGLGFRGSHTLPWKDTAFIYQIEASFSITNAPGVTTSYTAQSNTTKSGLGFGDTFVGFQNKEC